MTGPHRLWPALGSQKLQVSFIVSFLECGDLSPLSPVATCRDHCSIEASKPIGRQAPKTKAATGRRTPKWMLLGVEYSPNRLRFYRHVQMLHAEKRQRINDCSHHRRRCANRNRFTDTLYAQKGFPRMCLTAITLHPKGYIITMHLHI